MATFDKFLAGALGLIFLYLLLNSQNAGQIIGSLAQGGSTIFRTLQGR
jgi:hypothetical protein